MMSKNVNLQEEMKKRNMSENDLMQYIIFEDECIKNGYTVQELCNLMEKNVRLGAYKQCLWERDIAISQLESYGIGFGEKVDVKKAVYGEWKNDSGYDDWYCSECGFEINYDGEYPTEYDNFKYCGCCGAKMDGE